MTNSPDTAPKPDPNAQPPRAPAPTLAEAATTLTEPHVLEELAYHSRNLRSRDELAAALETAAVRHDLASEGFAERRRYDLAAGERESARHLRRWAEALRVVHAVGLGHTARDRSAA